MSACGDAPLRRLSPRVTSLPAAYRNFTGKEHVSVVFRFTLHLTVKLNTLLGIPCSSVGGNMPGSEHPARFRDRCTGRTEESLRLGHDEGGHRFSPRSGRCPERQDALGVHCRAYRYCACDYGVPDLFVGKLRHNSS